AHFVWRVLASGTPAVSLFHRQAAISCGPVRYADGAVSETWVDLSSDAFGSTWSQARSYGSGAGYSQGQVNGTGMVGSGMMHLQDLGGTVAVVLDGITALFFDQVDGAYVSRFSDHERLSHDEDGGVFVLAEPSGAVTTFFDFSEAHL